MRVAYALLQSVSQEGTWRNARHVPDQGNGRIARPAVSGNVIEMEFGQAQPAFPVTISAFGGLSPGERRTLADWVAVARKGGGIDTAEDLGVRPWPALGTETVIGVFKSGHLLASWLIVGRASSWAVASCGDSAVSARVPSLADALKLIYSSGPGPQG